MQSRGVAILGVDVARYGSDRTVIYLRRHLVLEPWDTSRPPL